MTQSRNTTRHRPPGEPDQRAVSDLNLLPIRQDLERAWDGRTRYAKAVYGPDDPASKGQCGVSSAYLADRLETAGYEVVFCEGDAFFEVEDTSVGTIDHHCWLLLPAGEGNSKKGITRDVIVDITADQAPGHQTAIIHETEAALRERGIFYVARKSRPGTEVDNAGLVNRLDILRTRMALGRRARQIDTVV
jgi:hypothetical protein